MSGDKLALIETLLDEAIAVFVRHGINVRLHEMTELRETVVDIVNRHFTDEWFRKRKEDA